MKIIELLSEINSYGGNYHEQLLSILREKHYWPAIQIKKFKNDNSLILLHNTYKRKDTTSFQELYDECRSVIIEFSSQPNIINMSIPIPTRLSDNEYSEIMSSSDQCSLMYDSTNILVFHHNDTWHFTTTTSTSIDMSRFSHPTKSHGTMFNEALRQLFPFVDIDVRDHFTTLLNTDIVYEFFLVHHQNSKYIDYTNQFGKDYMNIILNRIKPKGCLNNSNDTFQNAIFINNNKDDSSSSSDEEKNIKDKNLKSSVIDISIQNDNINILLENGIKLNKTFNTPEEGLEFIKEDNNHYGILVESKNNKYYKVSCKDIIFHEDNNFGNHNPWRNMIWIYQQNRDDFHINDYIKTYTKNIEYPVDNTGVFLDPTYIIHTVISTIKDILHNLYITTTQYYPKYNRFKMSKDIDKQLPPILQFHLAQLRHKQITEYTSLITINGVFHYLCHSNSVNNIISLINFFATHAGYDIPPRASMCFSVLNNLVT